ncbi:MAG: deoxynucleoside kinase [Candidatus Paceibacterota bacterium]|nr:MAG: deoxynucleoside kinase [Candidatus Paceibacterota bacterium]
MKTGKLIVIDGIDGSGKATQTKFLADRLKREGYKVKTIDFPRYYDNFFGALIGDYLSGKFGDFIQTDPQVASVLYAADRFESSQQIRKWLDAGYVVISDRYVSANQIHQGSKIRSATKRRKFLLWLDKMEFEIFKIPRPDTVIYLDVPFEVSKKWLENKVTKRSKKYLNGKRDVAEDNLLHLKDSRNTALYLHKTNKNWEKISCCKGNICMSPEDVHQKVFEIVKKKLKI